MPDLSLQKRLASEILGVGTSRIWINPKEVDRVSEAITREDIEQLIHDGVIGVKPVHSNSRERWKLRHEKIKKGRRRGYGKRKGSKGARANEKTLWMNSVRKIRRYLKYLRDNKVISRSTYRRLYRMAKGGAFRSLAHLKTSLKELGIEVK
ncbi:MAG: 50S ribosomal protein L19e [Desulfurococcaceae archaeon]